VAVGRSLISYFETASETGLIGDEGSIFNREDQIQDFSSTKNIYLLTGCQGDHFGALRRVTSAEHKHLKPKDNDLFIFSSKAIPGNEKKITRIYNNISEAGGEVITSRDKLVHASGHPSQEDLLSFYKEITPDYIIPIHGESYFLEKHSQFIKQHKLGKPFKFTNNDILFIDTEGKPSIQDNPKSEPILIHSKELVIERKAISARRKIATQGSIFVSLDLNTRNLELSYKGLPSLIDDHLDKIVSLIKGQLSKRLLRQSHEEISEEIRIFTRNLFNSYLFYKPITTVHIL
jgi:ribonuclease J